MNLVKRMITWFLDPAKTLLVTPARKRVARYSGEELRATRARNGVGRPPVINLNRGAWCWQGMKQYPAYKASMMGDIVEQPNLYEWQRKPRRGVV